MIADHSWQINPIFPGRIYEMYEIIDPEGRQVWCGTAAGLDQIHKALIDDLNKMRAADRVPQWMLGSLRQLRDRLIEQQIAMASRTA